MEQKSFFLKVKKGKKLKKNLKITRKELES